MLCGFPVLGFGSLTELPEQRERLALGFQVGTDDPLVARRRLQAPEPVQRALGRRQHLVDLALQLVEALWVCAGKALGSELLAQVVAPAYELLLRQRRAAVRRRLLRRRGRRPVA